MCGGSTLACRQCQQFNYESTRTTESNKLFDRIGKIRTSIGCVPGIAHDMGAMPELMHWTTFEHELKKCN